MDIRERALYSALGLIEEPLSFNDQQPSPPPQQQQQQQQQLQQRQSSSCALTSAQINADPQAPLAGHTGLPASSAKPDARKCARRPAARTKKGRSRCTAQPGDDEQVSFCGKRSSRLCAWSDAARLVHPAYRVDTGV